MVSTALTGSLAVAPPVFRRSSLVSLAGSLTGSLAALVFLAAAGSLTSAPT
jgi:hypothetical protein